MPLKKLLTIITKIFFGAFVVAYPFMIFYALQQNIAIRFLGLVLLMVVKSIAELVAIWKTLKY